MEDEELIFCILGLVYVFGYVTYIGQQRAVKSLKHEESLYRIEIFGHRGKVSQ